MCGDCSSDHAFEPRAHLFLRKQQNECEEGPEDGHDPQNPASEKVPHDPERQRCNEQTQEGPSRLRESEDCDGRRFSFRYVLLSIGEVPRKGNGGREKPEDNGGERALAKSRASKRDGGPDRHDRSECEKRRELADAAVAELEGRRAVTPCQQCAREAEPEKEGIPR